MCAAGKKGNLGRSVPGTEDMDAQQKCVTNLAATVVRQDQQIRELKSHIRRLESSSARSSGSTGSAQHGRTLSDILSDSPTAGSSCSSSDRGATAPVGSEKKPELWSSVLEAEEELREILIESKQMLAQLRNKRSGSESGGALAGHLSSSSRMSSSNSSGSSFGGH